MGSLRVAVAGATGLVGRTVMQVLAERDLPIGTIIPLASVRSAGTRLLFKGEELEVRAISPRVFEGCDVVFFAADAAISRAFAPLAAEQSPLVIDNSSAFRLEPDVPLVVPEINGQLLWPAGEQAYRGIVANPNCSTIQLVLALHPLHRAYGLVSTIVSTYQSVSGSGNRGLRALDAELAGEPLDDSPYPHRIAGNVLPHIDLIGADGWSGEERKMMAESRKILDLPKLHIAATSARVPVRIGHSEAVYARFANRVDADQARELLASAPGMVLEDDPSQGLYPLADHSEGRDDVFVGRIRQDPDDNHALAMWIVADNLRKGAATNAVQIAEMVLALQGEMHVHA
ncbi:MAG: aspartate-semialdehyde dehydrogenase [Chloroflexota bacterium]